MKAFYIKLLFLVYLLCFFSLNVHADWFITGEAVTEGTQVILTENPSNNKEFIYVGKLANRPFKITDGTKNYIHNCGDSDPLEQTIALREETESAEKGLRIRYVGQYDYFKVVLTVTRNEKTLTVQRVNPAKNLYIMGGPFSNNATNWQLHDAIELEQDIENPFVFYYKGDIRYNPVGDERGSFKILNGRSWSDGFHPTVSGNQPLAQAAKMRQGGEDNKWTIPADRSGDGYYEIKINTLDLTISVEKFVQNIIVSPPPLVVYITGSAMTCGWNNEHPIAMQKKEDGVFQWQGIVSPGEFKFLHRRGSWTRCYVATSANEKILSGKEHNIVYEENYFSQGNDYKFVISEEGESLFTLNINTMKLIVDGQPATGIDKVYDDNGITFFTENGKLIIRSEYEYQLQANVFAIDGRKVAVTTFVGSTEIPLCKGCYVVLLHNKQGVRIGSIRTLIY